MLEIWGIQSTPSLPSFAGPLWPRVVAGALTRCTFLQPVAICKMNEQRSPIWESMLHEFELHQSDAETTPKLMMLKIEAQWITVE